MIEAGISVVGALVVLEEQTEDATLADVITQLRADVEAGMLLSQAMARHPKVFNRLYIAMVETGEAAGILDQVLDRVAFQIEKETKIKRRVKSAMLYPTIVLTFAVDRARRDAHVPGPDLHEDLLVAERRPADADAVRRQGVQRAARLLVRDLPVDRRRRSTASASGSASEGGRRSLDVVKLRCR